MALAVGRQECVSDSRVHQYDLLPNCNFDTVRSPSLPFPRCFLSHSLSFTLFSLKLADTNSTSALTPPHLQSSTPFFPPISTKASIVPSHDPPLNLSLLALGSALSTRRLRPPAVASLLHVPAAHQTPFCERLSRPPFARNGTTAPSDGSVGDDRAEVQE
eukprot:3931763-Rhodomonas_salina.2